MNIVTNLKEKDGDGDDDEGVYTENISVDIVDNGWIVRIATVEGEEITSVYQIEQGSDMLKVLAEVLGVN